jgi:hypothetical protein
VLHNIFKVPEHVIHTDFRRKKNCNYITLNT